MNIKTATTTSDKTIEIDISDEECQKFGFIHDDIGISFTGLDIRVKGVGLDSNGEKALYYEVLIPSNKGKVCCIKKKGNLLDLGFKFSRHLFPIEKSFRKIDEILIREWRSNMIKFNAIKILVFCADDELIFFPHYLLLSENEKDIIISLSICSFSTYLGELE